MAAVAEFATCDNKMRRRSRATARKSSAKSTTTSRNKSTTRSSRQHGLELARARRVSGNLAASITQQLSQHGYHVSRTRMEQMLGSSMQQALMRQRPRTPVGPPVTSQQQDNNQEQQDNKQNTAEDAEDDTGDAEDEEEQPSRFFQWFTKSAPKPAPKPDPKSAPVAVAVADTPAEQAPPQQPADARQAALARIDAAMQQRVLTSVLYQPHALRTPQTPQTPATPKIFVVQADPLDVAHGLYTKLVTASQKPPNIVILNSADYSQRGGGMTVNTPEAQLMYRCALWQALAPSAGVTYPLSDAAVVWSPGVPVLHANESTKFARVPAPWAVNIVSLATTQANGYSATEYEFPSMYETTRDKLQSVLRVCMMHNQQHLVLGAWGAHQKHPQAAVAAIWAQLLQQPEFARAFATVVFAVPDPAVFAMFKQSALAAISTAG